MDLREALGRVIRRERKRSGLTQERLAELSDLHVNMISLIERGRSAPAIDTLEAIARALGRRPSQVVRAAEREIPWSGVAQARGREGVRKR